MSFIERMQNDHTPHERRQVAMQIAGIVTAILFVVWISTVGMRFVTSGGIENLTNTAATLIPAGNATTTLGVPASGF